MVSSLSHPHEPSESQFRVVAKEQRADFCLDVDLSLPLSGVTALFGESGAGKSSLLRVIAGLDSVSGASVQFGKESWQTGANFVSSYERRIGYVFQEPSLFKHLDVAANLAYAEKRRNKRLGKKIKEFDTRLLEPLGVAPLLSRKVEKLSGGEKQRVAIARALMSAPQLLLLDEPVSALDEKSKVEVLRCLQSIRELLDIPVIYVSHSLDEVSLLADSVVLMRQGQIAQQGGVVDMLLHPEIAIESDARLETLIEAEVAEIDFVYGLCRLQFAGGDLWVPHNNYDIGVRVRARIMARDLSLTLTKQTDTSIQNIIKAEIVRLRAPDANKVIVELSANGIGILAQITQRSVDNLRLEPGRKVFAQIKSVALLS